MSDQIDFTNYSLTCWYTGEDCPCCENAILATNGYLIWCGSCGYTRKSEDGPMDSQDNGDYYGEGVA